jgi:hypothetical protein
MTLHTYDTPGEQNCFKAGCHYGECQILLIVMLNVIRLSGVMLIVGAPRC